MASARAGGWVRAHKVTMTLRLAYITWFIFLFDPQWFLAIGLGIAPAIRVALPFILLFVGVTFFKPAKSDWHWGLMGMTIVTAINFPSAFDVSISITVFKQLLLTWLIGFAIVRAIRTPRAAVPIFGMLCIWQYYWWAGFGMQTGLVSWHPFFANYDGYGPLMVCGAGPAYFYGTAVQDPKRRRWAFIAAALCTLGVIASFKRGAVLGLVVTFGYIWFRSPRKGRMAGVIITGLVVAAVAGTLMDGAKRGANSSGNFWTEMSTMFETKEGSTGEDRLVLWSGARKVWMKHPVFGVGADHAGIAMANELTKGEIGGAYAENPRTLYQRALHNVFYQILSEYGLVGITIFFWMIWHFFKQTTALRKPEATAKWRALGGTEDVGQIALGLEAGVVGFLVTGYFYNQLFQATLWSMLFCATMMTSILKHSQMPGTGPTVPARGRRSVPPAS